MFAQNLKKNKMGRMKELFMEQSEQLAISTRMWMHNYDTERDKRIKLEQEIKQLKLTIKTLENGKRK